MSRVLITGTKKGGMWLAITRRACNYSTDINSVGICCVWSEKGPFWWEAICVDKQEEEEEKPCYKAVTLLGKKRWVQGGNRRHISCWIMRKGWQQFDRWTVLPERQGMRGFCLDFSHVTQGADVNKTQLGKPPWSWPISSDRCEKIGQKNMRGTGLC